MNSEVHPVVAALVLLAAATGLALWAWASGIAASLGGPAGLQTNANGHYFIEIQNYLVEHDEEGVWVTTHDLDAIGVDVILGGYAFFSNGDVLLRRGSDPRSFLDNVRAYMRETNRNSIIPEEPESGLFRCNLNTSECQRFGRKGVDFKAAYGIFIDWETDEVYISDTTRHLLRKYSPDGKELATFDGGFRFPNELQLHDENLLVADTNNHVIRVVEPQSAGFGRVKDTRLVVPPAAKDAGQRWPSHFARIGKEWWVNNMKTAMDDGGIYVFDDEWEYLRRVELPPRADPISILLAGDEVWVSDWNNDVVRRFSMSGDALPDLESHGLEAVLNSARQERQSYTLLSYGGVALIVLVLLGLVVRAVTVSTNKGPATIQPTQDIPATSREDSVPLRLEPDDKLRKRTTLVLRVIIALTGVSVLISLYLFHETDKPEVILPVFASIAGLVAIVLLIAWASKANWGTSIEVTGDQLTLRDYTGCQSSCSLRDVRYNETAIATPDAVVMLGNPRAQVYKRTDVQGRLIPRLGEAQRVGPVEMLKIQILLRHPQGIVTVIALVAVTAYAAFLVAS